MKAFKALKFPLRTVLVPRVVSHGSKFFSFSSPSKWFEISLLISLIETLFSSMFVNFQIFMSLKNLFYWASLVAQWLRIRLLMQGTQVRALVRKDPTCHGATKPVRHNY